MRLFISINFDDNTKQNMLAVQRRLKSRGRGRFTSPDNLHLTLAFLGDVPEGEISALKAVMDGIEFPVMKLRFDRIGCFRRDSELWWIGISEDPALMRLQKQLISGLRAAGFSPDSKRFRPHITLARDMRAGQLLSEELLPEPFVTEAGCISLMQSNYPAKRIEYTELYRVYAKA